MPKSRRNIILKIIVMILHLVGAIGTIIPSSSSFFIQLTPINLVITSIILLLGETHISGRLLFVLITTVLIGLGIEAIGVATGWPFGLYTYGSVLGPKLYEVPLVIGINWFLLSYCFYNLSKTISGNLVLRSAIASAMMVVMDFIIEPVAVKLEYWQWLSLEIPVQNYLAWFIISFVIQIIMNSLIKLNRLNPIALTIVLSQLFYFCLISIT